MYLVREGERSGLSQLILEGMVYRHKVTAEGRRQILSLHMRGDFIDLEGSLLQVADHNAQALEECIVAEISRATLVELIDRHGTLAHAMWIDTLIDASVYREWVVNVGARDSRKAMCHLLCEVGRRLEFAGLADGGQFRLPMTQEQLSDCLGITAVHVNRVLRDLDQEGVLIRRERFIEVPDRAKLAEIAGFNDMYLHLDLMVGGRRRH
jgi:CRP-like cAMP-binding protein